MESRAAFSMFELLLVLALLATLTVLAVPGVRAWRKRSELDQAESVLIHSLNQARLAAIREGRPWAVRTDAKSSLLVVEPANLSSVKASRVNQLTSLSFPQSTQIEFYESRSGHRLTHLYVNERGEPRPIRIHLMRSDLLVQRYDIDRLTGNLLRCK